MDISYKDNKLRKLCENSREASKKLGTDCAKKLRARLSDIEAAANVGELLVGRPHPLHHDKEGQFAISLAGGKRLILEPNHRPVPHKEDGGIHWAEVTAVTIVYVGDYHG